MFVGTGNNYILVRSILKQRWWYQIVHKQTFHKCHMIWTSWWKKRLADTIRPQAEYIDKKTRIYARMEDNHHLANKKCLFQNLQKYYKSRDKDVFEERVFPITLHIKGGLTDPEYLKLVSYFQQFPDSIWIVKPGENSNRGTGI